MAAARKQKMTVNDALVNCVALTLQDWNRSQQRGCRLRITVPVNLRNPQQGQISACNITGMFFLDLEEVPPYDLQGVNRELAAEKAQKQAAAFLRFTSLCGSIPHGLKLASQQSMEDQYCSTTVCVTNLGVLDNWWNSIQNETKGDLVLTGIESIVPLSPGTRVTITVGTLNGRLQCTIFVDVRWISGERQRRLLNDLHRRILDFAGE
jgi:NRPS condensation-like uncharacterized protein